MTSVDLEICAIETAAMVEPTPISARENRRRVRQFIRSIEPVTADDVQHMLQAIDEMPVLAQNSLDAGVIPAVEAIAFNAVGSVSALTSQDSTTPTAGATGTIVVPPAHDCIAIYTGNMAESDYYANIYVNDGSTTRRFKVMRNSRVFVNVSGGQTLAIGTAMRRSAAFAPVAASMSLKVTTFKRPSSLPTATGATGSALCDKNGPPYWSPTTSQKAHITLPNPLSAFTIDAAATRREVFITESDGLGGMTYVRHVHVPANKAVTVFCIGRHVHMANSGGATVAITAPTGTVIGGVSTAYRPSFTVTGRSYTVGTASDGVGGDQGSNADNLAYLLKSGRLNDGDEIVLDSGTYDMSTAGNQFNVTNHGSIAYTKSIRIRSATGDPADVIFTGAAWWFQITAGKTWVIEGCTFNGDGLSQQSGAFGIFCMQGGSMYVHECIVKGPGTSQHQILTSMALTSNPGTHFVSYSTISHANATDTDLISIVTNSPNNTALTLFACTCDGNGSNANNQIMTTHSAQTAIAYHCVFTDASNTANVSRIAPDSTGIIYLMWCECLAADITHADGLVVSNVTGAYFCNFPKVSVFLPSRGYAIGCLVTEVSPTVTREFFRYDQTAVFGLMAGCIYSPDNASGSHGVDARANVEMFGNLVVCSSASGIGLRINTGTPTTGSIVDSVNNRFSVTSPSAAINLGTSADIAPNIWNNIIDGYSNVVITLGASGANGSAKNNYGQNASEPANWDTRFPGNTGDQWINTDPDTADLAADGTPTTAGVLDDTGADPGYYGGIDIYGRSLWLGGSFVVGPVERAAIKSGANLFPDLW